MKKITAILLAVLMICSAMVTVAAAETEALEAPVFQGIQTRENLTDGTKTDVRFISTVSSLEGDVIGYEVVATFVNAKGETKNITYTGEKTEGTSVYSSILVDGKTKYATEYDENAVGIYVFTIEGMPKAYYTVFSVTTYVVSDDTQVKSTYTYENRVFRGRGAESVYTEDFNTQTVTPADYGATHKGVDVDQYRLENNKLVIAKETGWNTNDKNGVNVSTAKISNCFTSLLTSEELAKALKNGDGYHQSYVVSMDMEIAYDTTLPRFVIALNNNNATASNNAMRANSVGVRLYPVSGNAALTTANDLGINAIAYKTDGNVLPDGTNTTVSAWGGKYDITKANTPIKFNLAIAYTYNGEGNDAKLDLFVDGVNKCSYTVPAASVTPGLKFDANGKLLSEVNLYAQTNGADVKVDNLTVSVPADTTAGVVTGTALNALNDTLVMDYNAYEREYGIGALVPTSGKDPAELMVKNGQLSVVGGAWGSHFITLAPADRINAGEGDMITVDMKLTMNSGKKLSVFVVNDPALDEVKSYTEIDKAGALAFRFWAQDAYWMKTWIISYDSNGGRTSGENVEGLNKSIAGTSTTYDVRIVADGSTYSLYVNGEHCFTAAYDGDLDKVIGENSSIVLWAEGAEAIIDDLTITTFAAN